MKCGTTIGSSLLVDEGSRSVTPLFNRKLGDSTITITMLSLLVANFVCGKCIRSGNWLVANREWLIDELVPPTIHPQLRRSLIQTRRCLCWTPLPNGWWWDLNELTSNCCPRLMTWSGSPWIAGEEVSEAHVYSSPISINSAVNTSKHLMSGWLDTSSVYWW